MINDVHRNLDAARLMMDIVTATEGRLRGEAAANKTKARAVLCDAPSMRQIAELVYQLSCLLDKEFRP